MGRDCPRLIYHRTSLPYFKGSVCVSACVCVRVRACLCAPHAGMFGGDGACVSTEGVGLTIVCIVGVEADSKIPFALVSVGLDQI